MLAWVSPALIAELLGWKGIWGAGSAFFDALIPIPVAGGVMHVPGFAAVAGLIWSEQRLSRSLHRNYDKRKRQLSNRYGVDSHQLRFIESTARKYRILSQADIKNHHD